MKVLVIHGPNLQLLGSRQPEVYGRDRLETINAQLRRHAAKLDTIVTIVQSNHEGQIVELIGRANRAFDALVINPAAYTHTSVAIRDAIEACRIPAVEVHLSNIYAREEFRHQSLIAPVCRGQVSGFGASSYRLGLEAAVELARAGSKPASSPEGTEPAPPAASLRKAGKRPSRPQRRRAGRRAS